MVKLAPGSFHDRARGHHLLIGDIAVGEDTFIRIQFLDQLRQVLLIVNRDAFRVELAGQLGRIGSPGNIRDLGSRKGNHFIGFIVAIVGVESCENPFLLRR